MIIGILSNTFNSGFLVQVSSHSAEGIFCDFFFFSISQAYYNIRASSHTHKESALTSQPFNTLPSVLVHPKDSTHPGVKNWNGVWHPMWQLWRPLLWWNGKYPGLKTGAKNPEQTILVAGEQQTKTRGTAWTGKRAKVIHLKTVERSKSPTVSKTREPPGWKYC